jgi:hypothetical protein
LNTDRVVLRIPDPSDTPAAAPALGSENTPPRRAVPETGLATAGLTLRPATPIDQLYGRPSPAAISSDANPRDRILALCNGEWPATVGPQPDKMHSGPAREDGVVIEIVLHEEP